MRLLIDFCCSGFGEVTDSSAALSSLPPSALALRPAQRDAAGGPDRLLLSGQHAMPQPAAMATGGGTYIGRPPAPLPIVELMTADPATDPSSAYSPPPSMAWPGNKNVAQHWPSQHDMDKEEDETQQYASQLRSSMAALLQATGSTGHARQSSNSSSTYSSYSDELSRAASSPPPPPPPVRDASSLKYVKYGPGHEKHPSWPMPSNSQQSHPQSMQQHPLQQHQNHHYAAGSQRSKSWTEQTDYPKEPPAVYTRPPPAGRSNSGGGPSAYSQQLKTVLESCESRIPPEVYQNTSPVHHSLLGRSGLPTYLPAFDCDGRNIEDKDYAIPSPPERDVNTGPSDVSLPSVCLTELPDCFLVWPFVLVINFMFGLTLTHTYAGL